MKKTFHRIYNALFGPHLGFREKMFSMLGITGIVSGLIMRPLNSWISGYMFNVAVGLGVAVFSLLLLTFATVTGRYRIACLITILLIFMGYFPYLFITMGGIYGSKAINFVFAIVFTAYILEGKWALLAILFQLLWFTGLFVFAYLNPAAISEPPTGFSHLIDTIINMAFISAAISIAFVLHLRIYDKQKRKLDEQNNLLAEANLSKTQFLANSSHEMRSPLTIVSVNVQNVIDILNDVKFGETDAEAVELLADTQSEIMRLSRMVGGMLTLASVSENIERCRLDISMVVASIADVLQVHLHEGGNVLEIATEDDLIVFGDADLLCQVLVNLVQNAEKHTDNDIIKLRAARKDGKITITVSDNGTGIRPDILPRVFERGVTDGKGTGYGLYLCKLIVDSHSGEIWIESTPGEGTSVHIALPDYEGQFGGEAA